MTPFVSCLLVGKPRSGKSAWMSALGIDAFTNGLKVADPNTSETVTLYRVVSNLPFEPPTGIRVVDMRSFDVVTGEARKPDMTIAEANRLPLTEKVFFRVNRRADAIGIGWSLWLMDEAQVDTNARDWENMSERDRLFFSMFGHWRVVLILATQHPKFVDVIFRREVEEVRSVFKAFGRLLVSIAHVGIKEETAELGPADPFTASIIIKPKGNFDMTYRWPGLLKSLLKLSGPAFKAYRSHAPRDAEAQQRKPRTPAEPGASGAAVK